MTPPPPAPANPDDGQDPAAAALAGWRQELATAGGPNALLWHHDDERRLLELTHAHPAGLAIFLSGRDVKLSDLVREPRASAEAAERARGIDDAARRLWEERGLATCFVAAGVATWQMPGGRSPQAPVFLRPCELRPRDPGHRDLDVVVSRTVELNPALVQLVQAELGVALDSDRLARMSWGRNGFDPEPAYRELARQCTGLPGFTIQRRLVLGLYPYAKLPLVADLADADVLRHPVVSLLAGGAHQQTPRPHPSLPQVLPLDADQRAALAAIGAGDDVVVQGAPGTGMTQLVAAAVAGLAAAGRSVLLVSHKRAAVDAVRRRLASVGLGLVEEVHDGPDLRHDRRALAPLGHAVAADPRPDTAHDLQAAAEQLQDRLAALHQVREPWGVSAFQAQGAMVELSALDPAPRSRVRLTGEALRALSPQLLDLATRQLTQAAGEGAWLTDDAADPWRGARIVTPADADTAMAACHRLVSADGIDRLLALTGALADEAGLPRPTSAAAAGADLDLVTGVRATLDVFAPEVYDAPLPDMLASTSTTYREEHGSTLGLLRRRGLVREARRLLRPGHGPADLHGALLAAHRQALAWRDRAGAATRPVVPHGIDQARAAHDAVMADLALLEPALATTDDGGGLDQQPLDQLRERLLQLTRQPERLAVLPRVTPVLDELRGQGLGPLIDDLTTRRVAPDHVAAEVRHVWWSSLLDEVRRTDARYGRHDGAALHATATTLRRLEEQAHRERAQEVGRQVARAAEDGTPCWAVSPHEVAAVLPPGPVVDTVIVLEASQLSVAQAVSAISRGRQLVVCGDPQQLPPIELRVGVDDAGGHDVRADERSPSVLGALAAHLPVHHLETRYRSVDDRLATVLDTALGATLDTTLSATAAAGRDETDVAAPVTVPSGTAARGLVLEHVAGGDDAATGSGPAPVTTSAEVDRVARLVLAHARNTPERSLGVVALDEQHAAAVRTRLRDELARLGVGDRFYAPDRDEPFFVKHVDDAQGDTRDDMIVTVGYAVDASGQAGHRFGVLALAAGERRVAVALTRARDTVTLVSTLTGDELAEVGAGTPGVALLATALGLAQEAPGTAPSRGPVTDPVTSELASRLRKAGLEVTERAGRGAGEVELAVRDPRSVRPVQVAVESDGPAYAALPRPVDRDVLRPQLLERAGWRHLRVWTPDLFMAPEREVARIIDAAHDHRRPEDGR
ncbi:DUF4011 domain-containing protein [Arsenicicoccus sp. oral taxon 190]|uniref:DUF4011 domain-containing protein n=1 Tax=Arsenicicoccus sp. oral taxon 190 TaxID=1658671 RepID=UPI00067A3F49|nr:DUF4011 domain-containing protein [Arsenicicoccus sp. oral taxon 190]AKT50224.1 hypothetical protein ADJ73_00795 [Arsenicicoccus sp. oral taxon 190]